MSVTPSNGDEPRANEGNSFPEILPVRQFAAAVDQMAATMDKWGTSALFGVGAILIVFDLLGRVSFASDFVIVLSQTEWIVLLAMAVVLFAVSATFRFIAWKAAEQAAQDHVRWTREQATAQLREAADARLAAIKAAADAQAKTPPL